MMTRQRELLGALSTGDQVVTVGGVYGTIVALDGDEVRLEIAPDVVIRVARRAVAGRVGPPRPPARQAEEPESAPSNGPHVAAVSIAAGDVVRAFKTVGTCAPRRLV